MVKKLFISLVTLIPATVLAGFQVIEDADKPAVSVTGGRSVLAAAQPVKNPSGLQLVSLTYIGGEPDADIPVITGFGRDLKLMDAIKQIAPAGWQVFLKEDLATRSEKVNWKGGRRWTEVLDILANEQNLAVEVEWKKKHLYVGERRSKVPAGAAKTANTTTHWKIQSGEKMSEAFARWAMAANWQMIWEAPDLVAQANISLEGSFENAVGKIVDALNRNGSGLQAKFYASNSVLRIVEKK